MRMVVPRRLLERWVFCRAVFVQTTDPGKRPTRDHHRRRRRLRPGTRGDRVDGPVTGAPRLTRLTWTPHSQCIASRRRSVPDLLVRSGSGELLVEAGRYTSARSSSEPASSGLRALPPSGPDTATAHLIATQGVS